MPRESIADLPVHKTVAEGHRREQSIIDTLTSQGAKIRRSTAKEDRTDKIDGYLYVTDDLAAVYPELAEDIGQEVPIQIKDREGVYADIIFECRSDRKTKGGLGRDYVSKAKYFFCRPANNEIHCVQTDKLRKLADAGVEQHKEELATDKAIKFDSKRYPGVEIRRHYDRRDHYWKVLLFVPGNVVINL